MSLRPLIAVCGTTGVGKSKLAIELALSLFQSPESHQHGYCGARIINADAMQVYAGMDIITNKVSIEEQCGVEHLLMGFKKPGEQYVVGQWVRDALQLIEETHQRNQVPIVVGGTSYWIQHLLFPNRLVTHFDDAAREIESRSSSPSSDLRPSTSAAFASAVASLSPEQHALFSNLPEVPPTASTEPDATFVLHQLLSSLDPVVAQRWHWKDSRKVLRSLEIMKESNRLSSEIIGEQSTSTPAPRFRTLCLWLYAQPDVLNPRLDARVDEMIQRGLLREVDELEGLSRASESQSAPSKVESDSSNPDYTLGIYQSIGYREFHEYLNAEHSDKAYQEALERMKLSTRKYAKRQVSWLRNKLLPSVRSANATSRTSTGSDAIPTFLLDASELGDSWEHHVQGVAGQIMNEFLLHRDLPDPLSLSEAARNMLSVPEKPTDPNEVLNARRKVVCPVCTVAADRPVMIEDGREWTAHVQTRTHRKLAGRQLKDHASSTSHQHNQHPRVKHEENLEGLQDVEHTN